MQIIQNALRVPMKTIASNAGVEGAVIVGKVGGWFCSYRDVTFCMFHHAWGLHPLLLTLTCTCAVSYGLNCMCFIVCAMCWCCDGGGR